MADHPMITRSKNQMNDPNDELNDNSDSESDVDTSGNVKDLIDYECEKTFDKKQFQKELDRLRGKKKPKPSQLQIGKTLLITDLLTGIITSKLLETCNKNLKQKRDKKNNIKITIDEKKPKLEEGLDMSEEEIMGTEDEVETTTDGSIDIELLSEGTESSVEEDIDEEDEELEDDIDIDMDDMDEEYLELLEKQDLDKEEDYDIQFFHNLSKEKKQQYISDIKQIQEISDSFVPRRFKILNSQMDLKTKSIAIKNMEKLGEMDVSTGEYSKMEKWIDALIKIPFGKYIDLPIKNHNNDYEKKNYISKTQKILNKAIYGHHEAKMHILQVLGKWIKNPKSQGNVLAIQGPMGNGKTTLVKEGISKAINRPFAFIALGGASDSSFFDGFSYTYEGSHWGRIVDILMTSKCMNPVIYFDELDKISESQKGEEIIHLLTHLTDSSQNNLFQDNYFPGVYLDLSKCLFIFSFNDETKINRILKDRMYVIRTKGFKPDDKISICNDYILPEILSTFQFTNKEIIFDKESILYIIEKYTNKEEGVRNLKRCLESIVSKINIYNLSNINKEKEVDELYNLETGETEPNLIYSDDDIVDKVEDVSLTFEIKDFSFPLTITKELVDILLPMKNNSDSPPFHMYI